jgi:hypothetical protein
MTPPALNPVEYKEKKAGVNLTRPLFSRDFLHPLEIAPPMNANGFQTLEAFLPEFGKIRSAL